MHALPTMPARSIGPGCRLPLALSRAAQRSSRTGGGPRRDSPLRSASTSGQLADPWARPCTARPRLAVSAGGHEQAVGGPAAGGPAVAVPGMKRRSTAEPVGGPAGGGPARPVPQARRSDRPALAGSWRTCGEGLAAPGRRLAVPAGETRRLNLGPDRATMAPLAGEEEGRRPERPRRLARPARDPSPAREIQDPRETGPEGHQTQGTPDPRATRPAGCRTRGMPDPRATRPAGDWTRGMRDAEAGLPVDEAAQREGCRGLHDPSGTGGRGGRDRRTVRGPRPEASRGRRSCPWFSASPLP
jgi:hypothetical protein